MTSGLATPGASPVVAVPASTVPVATRPVWEVADVIRRCGAGFRARHGATLSPVQHKVLRDLVKCRTAALGGHVERCNACQHERIAYNSCRNRHCPKCQGRRAAAWLEQQTKLLLPVDYYHVVFTLPDEIGPVALQNPALVYGLLFQAASATLREIAADPKYLGAQIGVLAVLHTWGQTLCHHPHVHCVATGGGLACDRHGRVVAPARWVSCRPGFFLPVRVLSRLFRGKFLAGVRAAYRKGQLRWHGRLAGLAEAAAFQAWLQPLYAKEWVVYAKPPFAGPEVVLKYLARYTHRVALSNRRLLAVSDTDVTLSYKDYKHGGKERSLTLGSDEFLRRFLQHVLPPRFVKIRHYGLLAPQHRQTKLAQGLALLAWLGVQALVLAEAAEQSAPAFVATCPLCGVGLMQKVAELPRPLRPAHPVAAVVGTNTS